ncbi:plasmid mobilization relaxosome protein MobC [Tritonibacter scottomollicae]|uniref:Plasmid mobilization relaxosome protein MobC n=1 Tax=Tritonibacter scottomollicae TaxID=483013 RepID=A0ABZ0HF74_TRISK|nr:plasmid mobilization relaxosome protein MobC [Tritonibacter scottomollicae]WOI32838.1 plasmid mobilization relaxosome protein MobC [Tritonibacter scottomollicae]
MTAIDPTEEQTARRPMSYAGAADTGPCEGRQASPSNPTGAGKARTKEQLTETFVFRCTAAEKAQLRAKAEAAGLPAATLLREALGLTEARRRKPIPRVDPALVLAVGRIGGNLNQIARWLNRAMLAGRVDLDALTVARRLLTIERQLGQIVEAEVEEVVDDAVDLGLGLGGFGGEASDLGAFASDPVFQSERSESGISALKAFFTSARKAAKSGKVAASKHQLVSEPTKPHTACSCSTEFSKNSKKHQAQ